MEAVGLHLIADDLTGQEWIDVWLAQVEADLALLARFDAFYAARPEPA